MFRLIPIAALTLAGLGVAQADVYRWVDDKGEPHYSDQWVPGSTVVHTDKSRPGSDTLSSSGTTARNSANAPPPVDGDTNARAVQKDVAKSRDAQCKAAKDRYTKAIESRRMYKTGSDGNREYLSDTDADAYREVARKDVQALCGSVPDFDPNKPIPEPQPIPEPKVNPKDATSE
jgi:hypothetical protein